MTAHTMSGARTPHSLAGMPADTPVLLAFSGGADSSALLHWLVAQKKLTGFSLTLAHVNHGIRGEEALRDRDFCMACAQKYGVELCVLDADVPSLAQKSGKGLEETAREVRYAYFAQLMRQRQIPILVTAHHADDNFETVLFRMARGTGERGIAGIAPARRFADGVLVRPLLQVPKREIFDYCAAHGVDFVTDSTNADVSYARNRIRKEMLPIMESLFPGATRRVAGLTETLREDAEYLDALAEELLQRAECPTGVSLAVLGEAALPIRRRALYLWAERACGAMVEAVHMEALLMLCDRNSARAEVALPRDTVAFCERGLLRARNKTAATAQTSPLLLPLTLGVCDADVTGIRVFAEKCENWIKVHNLSTPLYIILEGEFDIIGKMMFWRTRKAGDVILMDGMHRRLRRLQAEAGIPARLRDSIPLLCDAEGIVWAPFVGVRDGVAWTQTPCADGFAVGVLLPEEK